MLKIYNTLARDKQEFTPITPNTVRMYVCGMTVYDYCHLGHARVMVVFDMVYRWFKASGYDVIYVRNITDIDDKIIKRAAQNNESIHQLTQRFIDAMHQDADALGVQRPDHEPRATQFVPQMLSMIEQLEKNGLAYQAADGDVNYAVRKFDGYGKLSGKSLEDLRAGERVEVAAAKLADSGMVWVLPAGDHAKRDVFVGGPFDASRRKHADAVGVQQQRHHHKRRIGFFAPGVLGVDGPKDRTEVELRGDVENEVGEVPFGQPVVRGGGQQMQLVDVPGFVRLHELNSSRSMRPGISAMETRPWRRQPVLRSHVRGGATGASPTRAAAWRLPMRSRQPSK